jgi:hypothetical protein
MENAFGESDDNESKLFAKHKPMRHQNLFQPNTMGLKYGNEYDNELDSDSNEYDIDSDVDIYD